MDYMKKQSRCHMFQSTTWKSIFVLINFSVNEDPCQWKWPLTKSSGKSSSWFVKETAEKALSDNLLLAWLFSDKHKTPMAAKRKSLEMKQLLVNSLKKQFEYNTVSKQCIALAS